jgi:hypothetical protein
VIGYILEQGSKPQGNENFCSSKDEIISVPIKTDF